VILAGLRRQRGDRLTAELTPRETRAKMQVGRLCRRVKAHSLSMMVLVGLSSAPLNSHAFSLPLPTLKKGSRHTGSAIYSADLDYTENDGGLFLPQDPDNLAVLPEKPISKSGVSHQQVVDGIDLILPPEGLDQRVALSRKDGYWPYITKGDEPPQEFVYGEFDAMFFAHVLDRAHALYFENLPNKQPDWTDKVFCDLGSGTGRLVLAAAALHPWKKCSGVELLENIHKAAEENLNKCRIQDESSSTGTSAPVTTESNPTSPPPTPSAPTSTTPQTSTETTSVESPDVDGSVQYALPSPNMPGGLALAPVEFSCGSFDDPYEYFGDSDCVFAFSTCLGSALLDMLSRAVGGQCKPGCIVITTEHQLKTDGVVEPNLEDPSLPSGPYKLELLEEMSGRNPVVGGISTVFFYRVVESLGDGTRRTKPQLSVEEQAFRVAKDLESGELTDTKSFMVGVHNNMAFLDLPESWRPKLDKY
jgi:hypothetical protein